MHVVTQIWLNCTRNVRIDCIEMDQLEEKVSISGVLSVRSKNAFPCSKHGPSCSWPGSDPCHRRLLGLQCVITTGQVLGIDARVFLVIAPILAALSWAAFNIGRAAVGQVQLLIRRSRA